MNPEIGKKDLYFLPLGGTGEIGMNLNLYGHAGQWLIVDLGITFADGRLPGIDVIMADPAFIVERRDALAGMVLTHAHEDHIGAVPYLWDQLRCPIYATPFTAELVRLKLQEAGLAEKANVSIVPLSGRFEVGPFEIELITLTHSIPEPNACLIRTAAGCVLHTGDWKLDPEPLIGETYDEARLRALAGEDILAMVCDSTNALVEGDSGSEAEVRDNLMRLVGGLENRVAVACFATNVARLETVMRVAEAHGRRVALIGRSMQRIYAVARETGYLGDLPPVLAEDEVGYLPRGEIMLLCTGSQGEPRAALWRIARDEHSHVYLEQGDTVIFSSRMIPGNEVAILGLQNELVRQGIEVLTDEDHPVHVSGHPAREELTQMYQWVRPRVAIPVHGEPRHLVEHAKLALECQVPEAIVAENGSLIRLAPGPVEIVEQVETGRLVLDGNRLLPIGSQVLRSRQKLMYNGAAFATLALDRDGKLTGKPRLAMHGVFDADMEGDALGRILEAIEKSLSQLSKSARGSDDEVGEAARLAIRRTCANLIDKKPVTDVHVVRRG